MGVTLNFNTRLDWSHKYYRIPDIHKKGYKGRGVKVATLDTGIDLDHDCFYKALEEKRLFSLDVTGNNDPRDYNGHGTWVASRIIGDGRDVLGFAPGCTLYSIKVLNDSGVGAVKNVVKGLKKAVDLKVDIISTSLGWIEHDPEINNILKKIEDIGITWISSSGNDYAKGHMDYPARYGYPFSVASHNSRGLPSDFSDVSEVLDVYAPGEDVKAAFLNNKEAYLSGTSMAGPTFAGLLALVYHDLNLKYGKPNKEILQNILTCKKLPKM